MKKFRLFSLMVSLLATAVAFTACSDNDEPEPDPVPSVEEASVTLKLGEVTDESIEFTLTPVNAVKAAWVCVEDTGREVTAEQVLGCTSADAEGEQTLVAEWLSPDTDYVIYAAVEGKDGKAVLSEPLKATTTGEAVEMEEFFAVEAKAEYWGGSSNHNWTLTLTDEEGNLATLDLYVGADTSSDYLPTTEFEVEDVAAPGVIARDPQYSYFRIGQEDLQVESGFLAVEALLEETEGELVEYAIMGEIVAGGRTFSVMYEGPVAGTRNPDAPVEVVLSAANLTEINDPQPGEFYVKLNDANWNYEVVLDFQTSADAAYLPANFYSLSDGSLLAGTSITGYYGKPTSDSLVACDAEVNVEGSTYSIDVTAEGDNGVKYHLTYEGKIKDMPEVIFIEQVYAQFSWDSDWGMGQLILTDTADPFAAQFFVQANLYSQGQTYVDGLFPGLTMDEVVDTGASAFLSVEESMICLNGDFENGQLLVSGKSWLAFTTLMPAEDNNLVDFQFATADGKIYCGSYAGPLYGGGGAVSTDPVDFPLYGVRGAEVTGKTDSAVEILFDTLSGPMQICFNTSAFGAGAYDFSEYGGNNTFSGTFTNLAIEWDEDDVTYVFESGRIGVVAQGDGAYTFQFDNVIARAADGSAKNLGPVKGNSYSTSFTVSISGL